MPAHEDRPSPNLPASSRPAPMVDAGRAQARADLEMEWHRSEPGRRQSLRVSLSFQLWILASAAALAALGWLRG